MIGLAFLHSQRVMVVHRDVKLGNIVVDKELKVAKLIDFGMAREKRLHTAWTTGVAQGNPIDMVICYLTIIIIVIIIVE